MTDLVSQGERDSYELELSGLTAGEMKALKARYESDDDPDGGATSAAKGIDLSSKSPMHAAMIKAALAKVERDATKQAKRVEAARRFRLEVYAGRATPLAPLHGQRYWAAPDELLLRGRGPVRWRGRTVTDFTRWVHSLYSFRVGSAAAMREGKFIERSIAKFTRPLSHPDWELVYCDPLIEGERPEAKRIPALTINGAPLWGVPDLVFRYKPTRELVIVERKASYKPIPVDGWPDLRAQLWCYAQIDDPAWREAPTIRLVGEVWATRLDGKLYLRANDGGLMRWTRGEEPFDSDNPKLWALYKAKVEAMGPADAPATQ
jgi:hypothetical protein